jgi:hypothetical protein
MLVLAIDPSGSYYEGKGTTGWAIFESETKTLLDYGSIKAADYATVNAYYQAVSRLIKPKMKVVIEEFLLYANKAKQQINSKMETSKLIGYLQMYCFTCNVEYTMQLAGEVVKRWADHILVHKGVIKQANGKLRNMYYALGRLTNEHERDAMRHAMHYITFKLKKENKNGK